MKNPRSQAPPDVTGCLPSVPSQNLVRILSGEMCPPQGARPVARSGGRGRVRPALTESAWRSFLRWLFSF